MAQTPGVLAAPSRQLPVPDAFSPQRSAPSISNGYLISLAAHSKTAGTVFLMSLADGSATPFQFQPPNATDILLDYGSVTADRHVLLAGTYSYDTGQAPVNFISVTDMAGHITATINSGAYTAERVCGAPDGTVWTLGEEWANEVQVNSTVDYSLLRHYGLDGSLKGSFLQRSNLPAAALNLSPRGRTFGQNVTQAYLSCGDHSVGAFIGAPANVWTQVDLTNGSQATWQIQQLPRSTRISGLAQLPSGDVYASFATMSTSNTVSRGLYRLNLPTTGPASWVTVPDTAPAATGGLSLLVGRDGPSLVHLRGALVSAATPVLYWSTP